MIVKVCKLFIPLNYKPGDGVNKLNVQCSRRSEISQIHLEQLQSKVFFSPSWHCVTDWWRLRCVQAVTLKNP